MAILTGRLGWLAAALAFALGLGQPADAVVVCQKGKKIKLRPDSCRANETPATLGGDDNDDLARIWKFTGGTMFDYSQLRGEFLLLNPDGLGRLNLSGGDGPVLTCRASPPWATSSSFSGRRTSRAPSSCWRRR